MLYKWVDGYIYLPKEICNYRATISVYCNDSIVCSYLRHLSWVILTMTKDITQTGIEPWTEGTCRINKDKQSRNV